MPTLISTQQPLAQLYAPVRAEMERVKACFDAEIQSRHTFVNALCERIKRYRGKMLRPALLLLTGRAAGGLRDEHITLGAVVEMVHIATLVHDDVLDEAELRRQQATVNAVVGNEAAVLLGDYLISHAFHLCASLGSTHAAREIGATTNTVCEGELAQIHHRGNVSLQEAEYIEFIRAKTGVLTGTCCALGARYAEAPEGTVEALRRFGIEAGVAFQIVDDVLDLTGTEDRVGKSLGRDLDLGKPTLPVLHALASALPSERAPLEAMIRGEAMLGPRSVAELLAAAGSLDYAFDVARRHIRSALMGLDTLTDCPAKASLQSMAEFVLRRDH